MKVLKILGLAAISAMALMAVAGAGTASATVLCKTPLTSGCGATGWHHVSSQTVHITKTAGTTTKLETTGGVILDTCTEETTHTVTSTTGAPGIAVTTINTTHSSGTCSRVTNTLKAGNLSIHHIAGTDNGTLTLTGGYEVTINTIFGTCVFGSGEALDMGKITGGSPATINTEKAVLPKISGNAACPSHGVSSAQFTVTSPSSLYVSAS